MGAIGTKSAVTGATDWTHFMSAASTSACDQATTGASGIGRLEGLGMTERSRFPDTQPLTGSSQLTTVRDHKGSVRATSKPKPQKAITDTAFEEREFSF
jgi:hypothetical protein